MYDLDIGVTVKGRADNDFSLQLFRLSPFTVTTYREGKDGRGSTRRTGHGKTNNRKWLTAPVNMDESESKDGNTRSGLGMRLEVRG